MTSAALRKQRLFLLGILLTEFSNEVLTKGRSLRVGDGVLRISRRKARLSPSIATGKLSALPEVVRLVWRGPAREATQQPRLCESDIESEARHG